MLICVTGDYLLPEMKKASGKEALLRMCEFRRSNKGSNRGKMPQLPAKKVFAGSLVVSQAQILLLL